jgi:hypothetical protein
MICSVLYLMSCLPSWVKGPEQFFSREGTNYGLTVGILMPPLLGTNSLLMNKPNGWVQFCPLGAHSFVSKLEEQALEWPIPRRLAQFLVALTGLALTQGGPGVAERRVGRNFMSVSD